MSARDALRTLAGHGRRGMALGLRAIGTRDSWISAWAAVSSPRGLAALRAAATVSFLLVACFLLGLVVPFFDLWILMIVGSLLLTAWALYDFRVGVVVALVVVHLAGTVLMPRELFGLRGLNPINVMVLGVGLSYFGRLLKGERIFLPRSPVMAYAYVLPFLVASLVGATQVHLIPRSFATLHLVSFTDGLGYLRDLFIKPLFLLLYAVLMALVVREARRPAPFVHVITAGCLLLSGAVIGLFAWSGFSLEALSGSNARGFLSMLGMHANEISLLLNLGYAILLFAFREQRGLGRLALGLALPVMAVAVLLTFSRAGIAAFLIVNLIFMARTRHFGALVLFLVFGLVLGAIFFDAIEARLTTGVQEGSRAAITAGRLDAIWLPLLDDLSIEWLLPHGPGAIMWSKPLLSGRILFVGHTHSAYVGLLYDYGVLLGLPILWFLVRLWREFLHFARTDDDAQMRGIFEGAVVALVVLAVQGLTDDHFTPSVAQTPLWCAVGMLLGRGGLGAGPVVTTAPTRSARPVQTLQASPS